MSLICQVCWSERCPPGARCCESCQVGPRLTLRAQLGAVNPELAAGRDNQQRKES